MIFEKYFEPFHVVAVLMRQQNAIELRRVDADLCEPQTQLFCAEPGIDHQAHAAALDDCRVSTTTTAKHRKTNHPQSL